MKRTVTVLSALGGLLALLLSLGALPASATVAQGSVVGGGVITDDWGDEGTLSQSSHAQSGATYLWQWVLYADGANEINGTNFDQSDIDGDFGPNTDRATRNWQSSHHIGVDGEVGPQTFGTADGNLHVIASGGGDIHISYFGSVHHIDVYRDGGVYWSHLPGSSRLVKATYGSAVFGNPPASCVFTGTCS
ncbi:MAG TPA: peptidoglycan-binding domain-containing protein [Mycobacteriales bacterium]|nr:peptidoglycan-binding domain-containing protein [Mycobacteriales bacterium]